MRYSLSIRRCCWILRTHPLSVLHIFLWTHTRNNRSGFVLCSASLDWTENYLKQYLLWWFCAFYPLEWLKLISTGGWFSTHSILERMSWWLYLPHSYLRAVRPLLLAGTPIRMTPLLLCHPHYNGGDISPAIPKKLSLESRWASQSWTSSFSNCELKSTFLFIKHPAWSVLL